MIQSIKIMLIPNNKQKTKMLDTSDAARYAYNWTVALQIKTFNETGKYLTDSECRKLFTQHKRQEEWLYNTSNDATKQAIKDCCNAFWRFTEKKKQPNYVPYSNKKILRSTKKKFKLTRYDMNGHPKFKKRSKAQPKFYVDTEKIIFTETHVKLEKIAENKKQNKAKANWIKLAETNKIPLNASYLNPRCTFDGINWWISVSIEVNIKIYPTSNSGIGIDLGIKNLAIDSNNNITPNINNKHEIRRLKRKWRRLQRSISRKYEMNKEDESYIKTSNIIKSEHELLKISQRLTGIRYNHLHQATNTIVKTKPSYIVTEDLNVQGMMKNKHLAKAVQEQCFFEFSRQLEYKSNWNGIEYIKAPRFFPSSKICSNCGNLKKNLKLSERTYKCEECGLVIDRDYNAAINLKHYGSVYRTGRNKIA
ncbi:MAG: transposase [Firmicutes bacterium]|nr:transposase [Bacillota bacterium]